MRPLVVVLILCGSLCAPLATGLASESDSQSANESLGLQERHGTFSIGGVASITTGSDFVFLDASNARHLLVDVMHNPPSAASSVLGMIYPTRIPLSDSSSYFVVLTYEESGFIKDEDADSIDYDKMFREIKEDEPQRNEERRKQGYPAIEMKGWAQKPRYDKEAHKLHWAKQLHFEGEQSDTLNYDIRVLGRQGVLNLNAVTDISNLRAVDSAVPAIMKMVDFRTGQTYAEYKPGVDKVAAYGIAGLVAGGVLVKTGFFKALLASLLVFKKAIGIAIFGGLAAIWGGIKRLFGSKR